MKLSIQIEGLTGLTWPRWKRIVAEVEELDFAGLYCSDHFTLTEPPDLNALEAMVSLTYAASHSQRITLGTLVAPFSFRDPVMLARQAMAIDDLSGGRMILGVGAGWLEREHDLFGYNLGSIATRLNRFEEGLEVVCRLIRDDGPVIFRGDFYQLKEAQLLPRPGRATPILIGAKGPKRTLPLTARYADIWNVSSVTPELFAERSALLDELIREAGRRPGDVRRTVMIPVICWQDDEERQRYFEDVCRSIPHFGATPAEAQEALTNRMLSIAGGPEDVVERLKVYEAAGVDEIMIQYWNQSNVEGLHTIARHVLPHFDA